MQASKTRFLDHLRWLRQAAEEASAELLIAGTSLQALLRRAGCFVVLHPRFLSLAGAVVADVPGLTQDVEGFAGWLPYRTRDWVLAQDRIKLNAFLRARNLPAPPLGFDAAAPLDGVLVRSSAHERRARVLGPFRSPREHPLELARGEYYEPYRAGTLIRLWYWNETLLCGELEQPASVLCDGASTLRELVLERAAWSRPCPGDQAQALLARCEPLLAYQGFTPGDTPPRGTRVDVDFTLGSRLMHPSDRQVIELVSAPDEGWVTGARVAGAAIFDSSPADWRAGTVYTLEGDLRDGELRLTTLDANPVVHPVVYPTIVRATLAAARLPSAEPKAAPEVPT